MPSNRRARSGFALPAVLAVTGVVTLVFLVAITALSSLTAEAAATRARLRFMERALSIEAEVSFMLATEPLTNSGVAVGAPRLQGSIETNVAPAAALGPTSLVRLDGRLYQADIRGPIALRLQDQAGMLNLANLGEAQTIRLGELMGLSPGDARALRFKVMDYTDQDDLRRLNGAESADYGFRIPNRPMLRPTEWLSLLDVREAIDPPLWRKYRPDLAADFTLASVNVNTATSQTLQVLYDLNEAQAASAIRAREATPFLTLNDFAAASGASVIDDFERIYTFPSGRVVYVISDPNSAWVYRARLTLTPGGLEQPVWIDQTELTQAPRRAVANIIDAARLPYPAR